MFHCNICPVGCFNSCHTNIPKHCRQWRRHTSVMECGHNGMTVAMETGGLPPPRWTILILTLLFACHGLALSPGLPSAPNHLNWTLKSGCCHRGVGAAWIVCLYECDGGKVNLFAEQATLKNTQFACPWCIRLHHPPLTSRLQTGRAQML